MNGIVEAGSDGRATNDAYARAFMGGDAIVFFDRVRAPWWLNLLMISGGVVGAIASAASGHLSGFIVAAAVIAFVTIAASVLAVLRVAVTSQHVHIQYGVFGPKIALEDIAAAEVVDYEVMRWGGWGIRRGLWSVVAGQKAAIAYSIPGKGGKAVRLTTTNGRVFEITSEQPAALCSAILQARAAQAASSPDLGAARDRLGLAAAPTADAEIEAAITATVHRERR